MRAETIRGLQVRDLVVKTPRGRALLDIKELSVLPGQTLGIRGPSGAGKSTLLYAIAGLIDQMSGQISWGDTLFSQLSPDGRAAYRAQHMGLIFQDFHLFEELSPLANAALPALFAKRRDRAQIRACAAHQLARLKVPTDARTVASFSGGERQRVAVARALANNAHILLADEPTASLDRKTADALIDDLIHLGREDGKTLVAVSHDALLLERMDRVITLENGGFLRDD